MRFSDEPQYTVASGPGPVSVIVGVVIVLAVLGLFAAVLVRVRSLSRSGRATGLDVTLAFLDIGLLFISLWILATPVVSADGATCMESPVLDTVIDGTTGSAEMTDQDRTECRRGARTHSVAAVALQAAPGVLLYRPRPRRPPPQLP